MKNSIDKTINCVLVDMYDTIIHRKIHPLYVLKLWSKKMKRDYSIKCSIDELYMIRKSSTKYICEKKKVRSVEIPYEELIQDIYHRLINSELINEEITFSDFCKGSIKADYYSEISVQYTNEKMLSKLRRYKKQGKKIVLITDIYLSEEITNSILKYHGIDLLFDKVYVSSKYCASKSDGSLYEIVLDDLNVDSNHVLMIGDNKTSDYNKPKSKGISGEYKPNYAKKNAYMNFMARSETFEIKRILKQINHNNKSKEIPFVQFMLPLYVAIEELYRALRNKKIENVFFLSREGLFMKELFDYYQDSILLDESKRIRSHYLRVSRVATTLACLKDLDSEEFIQFRRYPNMSALDFCNKLLFTHDDINQIASESGIELNKKENRFFDSNNFQLINKSKLFQNLYNDLRCQQKAAFSCYLNSFGVDVRNDGISLVDVGWGGTMQENIYNFLGGTVNVEGYYIGLTQVYDITSTTKRFGLVFKVYPYMSHSDYIFQANRQIYEQILSAPHGYVKAYSLDVDGYVIEGVEEAEKESYDRYIKDLQYKMFNYFKDLVQGFELLSYEQEALKKVSLKLLLHTNLFLSKKELKFLELISKGFFQNIGGNKVGINYNYKDINMNIKSLLYRMIYRPEAVYQYAVKVRSSSLKKYRIFTTVAVFVYYLHTILNHWIRKQIYKKLPL